MRVIFRIGGNHAFRRDAAPSHSPFDLRQASVEQHEVPTDHGWEEQ